MSPATESDGSPDPDVRHVARQSEQPRGPGATDPRRPGPLAGRQPVGERPHQAGVSAADAGRAARQGPDPAAAGRADLGHRSPQHVPYRLDAVVLRHQTRLHRRPHHGDTQVRRAAVRQPRDIAMSGRGGLLGTHQEHAGLFHLHRLPVSGAGESLDVLP